MRGGFEEPAFRVDGGLGALWEVPKVGGPGWGWQRLQKISRRSRAASNSCSRKHAAWPLKVLTLSASAFMNTTKTHISTVKHKASPPKPNVSSTTKPESVGSGARR